MSNGTTELDRPVPLYMQVVRQLRAQIASGELREGDRLPSEAQKLDLWARFHPRLSNQDTISDFWAEELQQMYQETKEHPCPFGDLPLTLARGNGFSIQLLLWTVGSTAIHTHSFSGAFTVLKGSSLHTLYQMETRQRLSAGGSLRRVSRRSRNRFFRVTGSP